ncbi:MAG: hypothetical protein IPK20_00140 [Betaproteobacteria bacterium]|nr:hypothetical protein [Betaproteobacteria bacterium]
MSKDFPRSLEERSRVRRLFGMQELLYDISILQFDNVTSIRGQDLVYLKRGLWIIESEMARDSRQALYDFNKLVLGNAQNVLFIGPQLNDSERHNGYLRVLKAPARNCASAPYLALIPHPDSWTIDTRSVKLYSWQGDEWSDDLGPFI